MVFVNNKNSVPFSVGKKRDCPGQSLAIKQLYAFFGNLLFKYKISAQDNNPNGVNIEYVYGELALRVEPQIPVTIEKRQNMS